MKLELNGEVWWTQGLVTDINNATEDIELVVNSPGGDVFEGLQVVNAIQKCPYKVTANVEVMSASIAAVITLACDNFTISKNDLMLLHNCWTFAMGNKEELREEADVMEKIDAILHNYITEHCNNPEYVEGKMNAGDYWLTGEEVAELFDNCELVERTSEKVGTKAASASLAKLVKDYNALLAKETSEEEEEEEEAPVVAEEEIEEEPEEEYVRSEELKELLAYDE